MTQSEEEIIEDIKKKAAYVSKAEDIEQYSYIAYADLKESEKKYSSLFETFEVSDAHKFKVDDMNFEKELASITENIKILKERIRGEDEKKRLDKIYKFVKETLEETKELFDTDGKGKKSGIAADYENEIKNAFNEEFDRRVEELIGKARIAELEKKAVTIKNKKYSVFEKINSKERLDQALLRNIELEENAINTRIHNKKKFYELEASLALLDTYVKEEAKKITPEIEDFRLLTRSSEELKNLVDRKKYDLYIKKGIPGRIEEEDDGDDSIVIDPTAYPVVYINKKPKRLSNRRQADIIEEQNNKLQKSIQLKRLKFVKQQNDVEDEKINGALFNFQRKLRQIMNDTRILAQGGLSQTKNADK